MLKVARALLNMTLDPFRHLRRILSDEEYRQYWLLWAEFGRTPRFTLKEVKCRGWNLSVPDAASFLSSYREIFLDRTYDFRVEKDDPRILDLGANIGLSVLFFKSIYPNAHVTAFEVDPKIFEVLRQNVHGNGFTDVDLVNGAAWWRNETVRFVPEGGDGGRLGTGDEQGGIAVNGIDLSEYLENREFEFLKVDIEGAEGAVLRKCRRHLAKFRFIFVEYHSLANEPQSLGEIVTLLTDAGFRLDVWSEHRSASPFLGRRGPGVFDLQLDIFARRNPC